MGSGNMEAAPSLRGEEAKPRARIELGQPHRGSRPQLSDSVSSASSALGGTGALMTSTATRGPWRLEGRLRREAGPQELPVQELPQPRPL